MQAENRPYASAVEGDAMELASESTPSESVEETKDPCGIAGAKENVFQSGRPLGDRGCDDTFASICLHDVEPSERVGSSGRCRRQITLERDPYDYRSYVYADPAPCADASANTMKVRSSPDRHCSVSGVPPYLAVPTSAATP